MILRFFRTNQPAASFAIPVVVLLLWLPGFFRPAITAATNSMPLYGWIYSVVNSWPPFLLHIISITLVSFQAIYLHHIIVKHEVLYKDSYLPSLMFAVVACCLPGFQQFSPVLLVNLVMLVAMSKSFALFKEPEPISGIFDCSFLIAVASLIYLPAASFIVLFLAALFVLRPVNWREWMVAFIGFFLPYFFISVYFFWTDHFKEFYVWLFSNKLNIRLFYDVHFNKSLIALITLFVAVLVVALFKLRDNFYKNAIKTRIVQQVVVLYFIVALSSAVLQSAITLEQFELLAFPLAVFYGYYFLSFKRRLWMSEAIFVAMLVMVVLNLLK